MLPVQTELCIHPVELSMPNINILLA